MMFLHLVVVCPFDSHPFKTEFNICSISTNFDHAHAYVCMDVAMMVLTILRQSWEKIIGILGWVLCWARKYRDMYIIIKARLILYFVGHM